MDLSARESKQRLEAVEDRRHALARAPHPEQVVLGLLIELASVVFEQRLAQSVKRKQRRPQVVGNRVAERLELAVDRGERGGALFDQHLELAAVAAQLLL